MEHNKITKVLNDLAVIYHVANIQETITKGLKILCQDQFCVNIVIHILL